MRGLFRGMTPRVIQTAPTMSIMMIVYDGINRFILHKQGHVDVSLSCVCSHALSGVCSHTSHICSHTLSRVCSQTASHPRTDNLPNLSALGTLEGL